MNRRLFLTTLAALPATALAGKSKADPSRVFGKLRFVTGFPDYKVKVVEKINKHT